MANKIPRVPVREQDPARRATNFEEVCFGYNLDEATLEASRCLNCKNPRCVAACPVGVRIPEFIAALHRGDPAGAAAVIARDSSLPSVCGRVCPQETQCEGACILGIKGEPVAIGKLERFVADWSRENGFVPAKPEKTNGKKVAVIGSGPAGLTCAGDLAKMGYEVTIFEALHEPGGVLVYSTCTFSPEENEGTVSAFLRAHEEYNIEETALEDVLSPGRADWISQPAAGIGHTLRLWPHC